MKCRQFVAVPHVCRIVTHSAWEVGTEAEAIGEFSMMADCMEEWGQWLTNVPQSRGLEHYIPNDSQFFHNSARSA